MSEFSFVRFQTSLAAALVARVQHRLANGEVRPTPGLSPRAN